ncbi:MAG: DUF4422 domain-containing protein [Clostridia bacterium]|nr:DUF4422 domain-containing protein [Clostridia bacterium]
MKNVKIIIATHKKYQMPMDDMYIPVHVGAEGKESIGFTPDNVGDNISLKNPNYCELTGLYWAWKNLDADYVGLAHYRRHFTLKKQKDKWGSVLSTEQCSKLLSEVDIILPKPRNYFIETNESQYLHAHHRDGWDLMCDYIETKYPTYVPALNKMKKSSVGHRFNMFIMKKELLNDYCTWLFDILFHVEKNLNLDGYNVYESRIFGFLSERLLDVWIDTNCIKYIEIPVCYMENENWSKKIFNFLRRKISPNKFE